MTKKETVRKLSSLGIRRLRVNAHIYDAFLDLMEALEYTREEIASAYHFFSRGWIAHVMYKLGELNK